MPHSSDPVLTTDGLPSGDTDPALGEEAKRPHRKGRRSRSTIHPMSDAEHRGMVSGAMQAYFQDRYGT